jgi:hypothetical protein
MMVSAFDSWTPTEDALFDRLGKTLLERQERLFELQAQGMQMMAELGITREQMDAADEWPGDWPQPPPELEELQHKWPTDRELANWQSEFGHDPRYWQLRAEAIHGSRMEGLKGAHPRLLHFAPLLEAWQRGAVDHASCQLLRELCRMAAPDYIERSMRLSEMMQAGARANGIEEEQDEWKRPTPPAEYAAAHEQARALLQAAGIAGEELLLRHAVEAEPELAWPRLELAAWLAQREEWEETCRCIADAAAGRPSYRGGFPQAALHSAYLRGQQPGCAVLGGMLRTACRLHSQITHPAMIWRHLIIPLRKHCIDNNRREMLPLLRRCINQILDPRSITILDAPCACIMFGKYMKRWAETARQSGQNQLANQFAADAQDLSRATRRHATEHLEVAHFELCGKSDEYDPQAAASNLLRFWASSSTEELRRQQALHTTIVPPLMQHLHSECFIEWWDNPPLL